MAEETPNGVTDKRAAIMASIDSARLDQLAQDGVNVEEIKEDRAEEAKQAAAAAADEKKEGDPPPEPEEKKEPEPEPEPEQGKKEPEPEPGEKPKAAAPVNDPVVKVIIDGEEVEVHQSELVRDFQKRGAADRRLQEASEILANAKRAARGEDEPAPKPAPKGQQQDEEDEFAGVDFTALAKKIQFGEEEEAGQALKDTVLKLRGAGRGKNAPTLSYEEIEQRVLQRIEAQSAVAVFGNEFQDILTSPVTSRQAADLAFHMTKQAREDSAKLGKPMPALVDIYRAAGTVVRNEVKRVAGLMGLKDSSQDPPEPKKGDEPAPKVDLSGNRDDDKRRHNPPAPRVAGTSSSRKANEPVPVEQSIGASRASGIQEYTRQRAAQRTGVQ